MNHTKICTRCKVELPATTDYFTKEKGGKYGLRSKCIKCRREEGRQYTKKNKKQEYERKRKWNIRNKEYMVDWRKNNQDKIMFYRRNYIYKFSQVNGMKNYLRRKKKSSELPMTFTGEEWESCKKYFDYKCAYCGESEGTLEQDHFIPLNKYGEYTRSNIVPSCRSCNSSKSDSNFFEWYPYKEFYSKKREKKILRYLNFNKKTTNQITLL